MPHRALGRKPCSLKISRSVCCLSKMSVEGGAADCHWTNLMWRECTLESWANVFSSSHDDQLRSLTISTKITRCKSRPIFAATGTHGLHAEDCCRSINCLVRVTAAKKLPRSCSQLRRRAASDERLCFHNTILKRLELRMEFIMCQVAFQLHADSAMYTQILDTTFRNLTAT